MKVSYPSTECRKGDECFLTRMLTSRSSSHTLGQIWDHIWFKRIYKIIQAVPAKFKDLILASVLNQIVESPDTM
ncbi:hypothetical protein IX51_07955 [uncultured archaeon]|nr:hypothetical protein IX51_07955 [uncultured archaeon]